MPLIAGVRPTQNPDFTNLRGWYADGRGWYIFWTGRLPVIAGGGRRSHLCFKLQYVKKPWMSAEIQAVKCWKGTQGMKKMTAGGWVRPPETIYGLPTAEAVKVAEDA